MIIIKQVGRKNQVNVSFNFVVNNWYSCKNKNKNNKKEDISREKEIENNECSKSEQADEPLNKERINEIFRETIEKHEEKKIENLRLEQAYIKMELWNKAESVHYCATFLEFLMYKNGKKKLLKSNFCRDRLCPECAWRRSLKLYAENKFCFKNLGAKERFIFLTVTCKNVTGNELKDEITRYFNGFKEMMKRKEIKKYVLGMIKTLEVTYNKKNNTFHPHIHCILHVKENYFQEGYISQNRWRDMWAEEMNLDYEPKVFIKAFKINNSENMGRELAEVSKYCVKFKSFAKLCDKAFFEVIEILDDALYRRRLITFSGSFREARKQLKFKEDIQDKQELDIEEELDENDEGYKILYFWHFKEQMYKQKLEEV